MSAPLLSVCLITYNHEKYIRQAIEGVLMQKVDFTWELIIAEDCSTDNTRAILLEYQDKHPDFIKLILQEKNVGPAKNWLDLMEASRSKYIAYLEGDDYWTDPLKLQKQVDFLVSNKQATGCFHHASFINEESEIISEIYNSNVSDFEFYNQEHCLTVLGSSYASCTLVFKRKVFENVPKQVMSNMYDEFLDLVITENGLLYFINFNGANYRFHHGGAWSGNSGVKSSINMYMRTEILYKIPIYKKRYFTYLRARFFLFAQNFIFSNSVKRKVRVSYFFKTLQYLDYSKKETYNFIFKFISNVTGLQKMLGINN